MSGKNSKVTRQDRLRLIVSGATKHFQPNTPFTLAGVSYTLAALTQLCQKDITASDSATQAKAAWLAIVQSERDDHSQVYPVLRAFKAYVVSLFGDGQAAGTTLADFGYSPRKVRAAKVAVKAAAAVKVVATRKARGTMGPVQRKAITGSVTSPSAPVTATAAPVSAPKTPEATAVQPALQPATPAIPARG
ncbi:MAG: hypothetical protein ACREJ3_10560 [Polyangiaceae bacterium]